MNRVRLDGAREQLLEVPGGRISAVELGEGPLVILIHGFPEGWWSWRYQLPALAAAGFRAVAIDVRGYGASSQPTDVEAYRMLAHVADTVAVVRALGSDTAVVVGHDWGSPIAATCALMRPDVFTAVGLLGVPYTPRGGVRPTEAFALAGGEEEFYVSYFQQPGRAEAEIQDDIRSWLRGFYVALDGEPPAAPRWFTVPAGGAIRNRLPTDAPLPLDQRGRVRRVRCRVRAQRVHRPAQPLPQPGPRLGGPRRLRRRDDHTPRDLHRGRARHLNRLAVRRHRPTSNMAPRPDRHPPPPRHRALGATGTPRPSQRPHPPLASPPDWLTPPRPHQPGRADRGGDGFTIRRLIRPRRQ